MSPNLPARQAFSCYQGFTLLEILIAMAIFTLIGLASANILTTVIDSDQASAERFAELEKLQRAMLTIERDILQAMPRAVRVQGENNEVVMRGGRDEFESEADGLGFVRGGWQNPQLLLPRGTLQAVAYRLLDGELHRLYGNYVDNPIGYEPKQRVLLTEIDDLRIEYMLDNEDPEQEGSWEDSYTGSSLPTAIAVEIDSQTFGTIRREFFLGSVST